MRSGMFRMKTMYIGLRCRSIDYACLVIEWLSRKLSSSSFVVCNVSQVALGSVCFVYDRFPRNWRSWVCSSVCGGKWDPRSATGTTSFRMDASTKPYRPITNCFFKRLKVGGLNTGHGSPFLCFTVCLEPRRF